MTEATALAIHQHANGSDVDASAPARRCFIAARPQADITGIRRLLADRGISATASYERPWLGARPLDTVMTLIEDADVVIAVLDDPSGSANSMFEVGFAFARDKKILVVVPRTSMEIPSNLDSTLYVRADTSDSDVIGFNLDQLLAAPQPRRKPYIPAVPQTHPIGSHADRLLLGFQNALEVRSETALERVAADAFRAAGVEIVRVRTTEQDSDARENSFRIVPYMSIWSDDLESSVGNPLLIEVKMSVRSWRSWKNARQQFAGAVATSSAMWGLLLYGFGPGDPSDEFESEPPILALSMHTLLERLRTEGFAAIVGSLRDQAITVA